VPPLTIQAIIALMAFLAMLGSAAAHTQDDLLCSIQDDWKEGSDKCPCRHGWKPSQEQLERILNAHRRWIEQKGWQDQTIVGQAILCNADLHSAHLRGARLIGANLRGADLTGADLEDATLANTYVDDARIAFTNLTGATYATIAVPQGYVAGINGLATLVPPFTAQTRRSEVSALVHLRELLQQSGLRDDEREVTFAIEHWKTRHALDLWRENFLGAVEGVLRLVLFEWTTAYGLRPFRALQILLALVVIFALGVYFPALLRGGLFYRISPNGRLEAGPAGATLADQARVEALRPQSLLGAVGYALQFSLLSAFQIGWRELNVGNWIARLQRHDHMLKVEGWVRTVAGIQSLISVYLLAIWVLTYFGRPFQ